MYLDSATLLTAEVRPRAVMEHSEIRFRYGSGAANPSP